MISASPAALPLKTTTRVHQLIKLRAAAVHLETTLSGGDVPHYELSVARKDDSKACRLCPDTIIICDDYKFSQMNVSQFDLARIKTDE